MQGRDIPTVIENGYIRDYNSLWSGEDEPMSSMPEMLHTPRECKMPQLPSQHDARPSDSQSPRTVTARQLGCYRTDNTLV
jgi:hypothetical protein